MVLRLRFFAVAVILIGAGLVVRLLSIGLSPFVVKYLGSALWGGMVFAGVGVLQPARSRSWRVVAAVGIAAAVEVFRLYHAPALDAFRLTLAGRLLLGRVFSVWNIVAYCFGIAVVATIEGVVRGRRAG